MCNVSATAPRAASPASTCPAGLTPENIREATLRRYAIGISGDPCIKPFLPISCTPFWPFKEKSVIVDPIHFGDVPVGSALDQAALSGLYGIWRDRPDPAREQQASLEQPHQMVHSDWQERASRGNPSRYRVKFLLGTDNDDQVNRVRLASARQANKPQLVIISLIP